eukprot:g5997.t1
MDSGERRMIEGKSGVQQGDGMGPPLFCFILVPIVLKLRGKYERPGVSLQAYMDDISLHFKKITAENIQVIPDLVDELEAMGIVNRGKCAVLPPPGHIVTLEEGRLLGEAGLPIAAEGIAVVGVPIGTDAYIEDYAMRTITDGGANKLARMLARMPDKQVAHLEVHIEEGTVILGSTNTVLDTTNLYFVIDAGATLVFRAPGIDIKKTIDNAEEASKSLFYVHGRLVFEASTADDVGGVEGADAMPSRLKQEDLHGLISVGPEGSVSSTRHAIKHSETGVQVGRVTPEEEEGIKPIKLSSLLASTLDNYESELEQRSTDAPVDATPTASSDSDLPARHDVTGGADSSAAPAAAPAAARDGDVSAAAAPQKPPVVAGTYTPPTVAASDMNVNDRTMPPVAVTTSGRTPDDQDDSDAANTALATPSATASTATAISASSTAPSADQEGVAAATPSTSTRVPTTEAAAGPEPLAMPVSPTAATPVPARRPTRIYEDDLELTDIQPQNMFENGVVRSCRDIPANAVFPGGIMTLLDDVVCDKPVTIVINDHTIVRSDNDMRTHDIIWSVPAGVNVLFDAATITLSRSKV